MTTQTATPAEAPVTEWETFEGETYGYNDAGARIVEISAKVRQTSWQLASNVRGWAAMNDDGDIVGSGNADGLRAAKKEALAALRVHRVAEDAYKPRTLRLR